MSTCFRCQRDLSSEKPVNLPDGSAYCAACCLGMATDSFEMETGEPFVNWIEKHPKLTMQYQTLEMSVRRMAFFFPLMSMIGGVGIFVYGCVAYLQAGKPAEYLAVGVLVLLALAGLALAIQFEKIRGRWLQPASACVALLAFLLSAASVAGIYYFGRPAGYMATGLAAALLFGALAVRGLLAYLRAMEFVLTLENGEFNLKHGAHRETFKVADLDRVCVVRPGTVGATEGALGFKDGRMLTLDTCLSDLHALGVVLDLRFREDFPPSPDDLAKLRRDKLRKIRGLST